MAKRQQTDMSLSEPTFQLLQTRAGLEGCSMAAFVERAVNRELGIAPPTPPPKPSDMVAYPLTLPVGLHKRLKQTALDRRVSMAHIMRQGIKHELERAITHG